MRTGTAEPKWILSDHLGSTSVVTAFDGTTPVYQRYKPFGETRLTNPLGTKYTFTGQLSHTDDFGLLFFNARWVDPELGRFAQADTLVPDAYNPQDYDRYSYTRNNPLRYVDPSGHDPKCGPDGIWCDDDSNNDYDYPYMIGSYMPDPALTPDGRLVYSQYLDYQRIDGWWNNDGDFTIEDFVGLWILFESVSEVEVTWSEQGSWIATAIAQNLYVGGWRDATGASRNAVFNFIGLWLDADSSLGAGPNSKAVIEYNKNHPQVNHQTFIKQKGTSALHPTQLNFDRNRAPSIWGNIKGALNIQVSLQKLGRETGPVENSVYYINPSFVVLSANQHGYWSSKGIDMSFP